MKTKIKKVQRETATETFFGGDEMEPLVSIGHDEKKSSFLRDPQLGLDPFVFSAHLPDPGNYQENVEIFLPYTIYRVHSPKNI